MFDPIITGIMALPFTWKLGIIVLACLIVYAIIKSENRS